MGTHFRGGLLLALFSLVPFGLTTTASAQFCSHCCRTCQRPVTHCNCQAHRQVVETQMVPQQVTTYRNEVVTAYRQEAITQAVPVTTYRDVIVDEGSYQTVYVPKQVTKRIPQVSYQQQIAYRSVPYQMTRQVPQVVTQMVPQQTVKYQPYSFQTTMAAPVYSAPPRVSSCAPCGGMAFAPLPVYQAVPTIGQPVLSSPTIAAPMSVNPVTMLPPTSTATSSVSSAPDIDSSAGPVPDPKFLESPGAARDSWTTVGSRHGSRSNPTVADSQSASNGDVRFQPSRTVYRSWENQSRVAGTEGPERR